MHQDLRYAGMLPPLDAPHHLRASEWGPFREGVVRRCDPVNGSCIDVGLEMVRRAGCVAAPRSLRTQTPALAATRCRLQAPSQGKWWGFQG
jgi:hypothetical protein